MKSQDDSKERGSHRFSLRSLFSGAVFWIGVSVVCIIAIPVELLMGIISIIMKVLDFIIRKVERE